MAQRTEGTSMSEPVQDLHGVTEVQGPLVRQHAPAARLARIFHAAAYDLWDISTLDDETQMKAEAGAVASRILASCPGE